MTSYALGAFAILALLSVPVFAANAGGSTSVAAATQLLNGPPGAPYEKVSQAIKGLPDFIPTMGMVYVDPNTLPDGPYLGYSRDGKLIDTVYMITIKTFDGHQKIAEMAAPAGQVDHVGIYYNPGHAGMAEPHYHIVLWHVPKSQESVVAK